MKVYTMSVSEFMNKERIEELNKIDRAIAHIKKNKKKYMQLVFIVAIMLILNDTTEVYALGSEAGLQKFGKSFDILIGYAKEFAYKSIMLMMIINCGLEAYRGGNHNIGTIITRYLMLMAGIFGFPWLVDILRTIFP